MSILADTDQTLHGQLRDLLGTWCQGMLRCQLDGRHGQSLNGGLICPAEGKIDGRCHDAIYPMMAQYRRSGDERFRQAAIRLADWSQTVSWPDGSFCNGNNHLWKGITVFATIAWGEALRLHGDLLPAGTRAAWRDRLARAATFIQATFTTEYGNINYPLSVPAALQIAGMVLEDPQFLHTAKEFAQLLPTYLTPEGFIFGEGHGPHGVKKVDVWTRGGFRYIDLGYNVEETLPNLAHYAHLAHDQALMDLVEKSARTHLDYMLPDGAWDNSWGSRAYKWTWWGSRTSDGCAPGFLALADRDPVFAEAARRNLRLLKQSTHGGLLAGGPHLVSTGQDICIHHTFSHAKAVASALDLMDEQGVTDYPRVALPREVAAPLVMRRDTGTHLLRVGAWHATLINSDTGYSGPASHAGGGSLGLVFHRDRGAVLASSLMRYAPVEAMNQMPDKSLVDTPLTVRIEVESAGKTYRSDAAGCATITSETIAVVSFSGTLKTLEGEEGPAYTLAYALGEKGLIITATCDATDGKLIIPAIASPDGALHRQGDTIQVGPNCFAAAGIQGENSAAIFNHVPGFRAVVLTAPMPATVSIS